MLQAELTPEQIRERWEVGALDYLLRPYQREVYDAVWDAICDPDCLTYGLNIGRRWGKTTLEDMIACEVCLRVPGAQVRFAAPTGIELRKRTLPIMRQILRDCPEDLRPHYNGQDKVWSFPNGSEIHLAGVNNEHEDDLRGAACHLACIDEAGFIDKLDYLRGSVLAPQTLDTGGTMLISSTPPLTPAHDYCEIAHDCEKAGWYTHRDIYSMGLPDETIRLYQKEAKCKWGADGELIPSSTWRREYLALFVVDDELRVTPEWRNEYAVKFDRDPDRFPLWHKYAGMDLGVRDFNATLWGYYDFERATLVIEHEWVANGPEVETDKIAHEVRKREAELGYRNMYRRVADNNNVNLLVDLSAKHGITFHATSKDELPAMVNFLRIFIGEGRLSVDPSCENLIGCLKYGVWKDTEWIGRELGRSKAYGHYDALMALVYLVRNLDVHTNPIPRDYGIDRRTQYVSPRFDREYQDERTAQLAKVFGPKRRVA